jgi:hypothetical protein
MLNDYKPYIAKTAYYILQSREFDRFVDLLYESGVEHNYRELCEGGAYVEIDVNDLSKEQCEAIGFDIDEDIDLIIVWMDI